MKNRFIVRAVSLVLVLSIAVAIGAAPAPERDPFKGKIVVVTYFDGNSTTKAALEQTRVQKLGERYYVVGKVADSRIPRFMIDDCTLWIPENSVRSMAEFESIEKVKNALLQLSQDLPVKGAKGPKIPIDDKK